MSEMDNMTCRKESAAYKDGDFEIIASDGLVFRIQSYHLLSASTVIRNMFSTSSHGDRKLELDGKDLEQAITVEHLLDVITGRPWEIDVRPDPSDISKALRLARKFECIQAVRTFTLLLSDELTSDPTCADEVFFAAATNGLDDLCERAICQFGEVGDHQYDEHENGKLVMSGYAEGRKSDPANWSITQWMSIPPEYTWALMRCQVGDSHDISWVIRARFFMALLQDYRRTH